MININVLLTEQDMAASFLVGLKDNYLPERFFYWFPLSVRAWLDLCSDGAYKNFIRSYQLIEDNAADIATHLPQYELEVISLGAGQGDKDVMILKALVAAGHSIKYTPVDASQALLELACSIATRLGFTCQGIKANITNLTHLKSIFSPKASPGARLTLLLGNTLGAFDPVNYIKTLHNLLTPDDFLLLDGEFYAETQTIAGYDNPLNRQFAFAPLHSIGITETDGDLRFQTQEDDTLPGLYRLTKHFLPHHDFTVQAAGESIHLEKDVKIEMGYSGKYAQNTLHHLIDDIGGFHHKAEYITVDKRFAMILATQCH